MNYLAHLFLADESSALRVGAVLGDFVRGPDLSRFEPALERGIRFHRAIDSFVDTHAGLLAERSRFTGPSRRVAGIYLDLAYDVFLSETWAEHTDEDRDDFIERMYEELTKAPDTPVKAKRFIRELRKHDLLHKYGTWEGLEETTRRIARRFPQPERLTNGLPELRRCREELAKGFREVWPEIVAFAEGWRKDSVDPLNPDG